MRQGFINVLRSSADERRALFKTVASDLQTHAENIEKDLYVCWVLDFPFNGRANDQIGLYFKGGTSLSKAYGLINRFSEDINIGIYQTDLKVPTKREIAPLSSVPSSSAALTFNTIALKLVARIPTPGSSKFFKFAIVDPFCCGRL